MSIAPCPLPRIWGKINANTDSNNPPSAGRAQSGTDNFFAICVPYFSKKPFTITKSAKTNMNLWLKNAKEWNEMDFREILKKYVQCPVLILAGVNDPNHPIACAIETANYIPKKYLHFNPIQNAGTPVYHDQPEEFRIRIETFLQNLGI